VTFGWLDVFGRGSRGVDLDAILGEVVESLEQPVEVAAGELPLERGGDLLVVAAEGQQVVLERVEVFEVVGLQRLALGDGEVDLGLVEPGGVDRGWTTIRLGQAPWRRSIERWPRCAEPLSTIRNTRCASV
jgi:hypothetical protein